MPHCSVFDERTEGMLAEPEEITMCEMISLLPQTRRQSDIALNKGRGPFTVRENGMKMGLIIKREQPMPISPLAGKPADQSLLINVPRLVTAYYTGQPDPSIPAQRVVFGTSGHRADMFRQLNRERPNASRPSLNQ